MAASDCHVSVCDNRGLMTDTVTIPFSSVGLAEPILRAVAEKGYTTMSPIQARPSHMCC